MYIIYIYVHKLQRYIYIKVFMNVLIDIIMN